MLEENLDHFLGFGYDKSQPKPEEKPRYPVVFPLDAFKKLRKKSSLTMDTKPDSMSLLLLSILDMDLYGLQGFRRLLDCFKIYLIYFFL